MAHFFVNNLAHADGNHEVHVVGCRRMGADKRYLGNFYNIDEAMIEARKDFWQSASCERCAGATAPAAAGVDDSGGTLRMPIPAGLKFI